MTHSTGIFFADSDDDMDLFEARMPDGIISLQGGAGTSSEGAVGAIDMKVSIGLDCAQGMLSLDMARELIAALQDAVLDAEESIVALNEMTLADSSEPTLQ